jgi:UV DNA damage endonuclease
MNRKGVCCIVLSLEEQDIPKKFKTMTYKRFSQLPREQALRELSSRILNNMDVTYHAIKYCADNGHTYRLSSDLFPLITYDKANVSLQDLPDYNLILDQFNKIKSLIQSTNVRVSCHPSEFNVLASDNQNAIDKTIKELNFYGWFMTQIGCPLNYNSPMNMHIHNSKGDLNSIVKKFMSNFDKLSEDVKTRLVIENDDKDSCWSIKKLMRHFHSVTAIPITFDYLHHKCHPDGLTEKQAFELAYSTWNTTPLFHYSESIEGHKNPRKHADYATRIPDSYGLNVDVDFELKMKEKSFASL